MKNLKSNAILQNFNVALLVVVSLVTACVTVNVNFPESAVQKATDDYVRDLYRTKEQGKSSPKGSTTPSASTSFNFNFPLLIPSAQAADQSFNLASPKISAIKDEMKAIIPEVLEQKKAGVLGETNDGKLIVKDASKLKPILKKKVEDLVRDENKSRDALYAEVVQSNKLPGDSLPAVKRSFSRSFQAESPSGTWVQGTDGAWSQKP